MDDLEAKVFDRLPDETWFYPGHGDDSTLGAERASIPSGAPGAGEQTPVAGFDCGFQCDPRDVETLRALSPLVGRRASAWLRRL